MDSVVVVHLGFTEHLHWHIDGDAALYIDTDDLHRVGTSSVDQHAPTDPNEAVHTVLCGGPSTKSLSVFLARGPTAWQP